MIFLVVATAWAQGAGNGISKSTYACSESAATSAFAWLMKYLPVEEANDDCPDRSCTCGEQSRVALQTNANVSPGFGIHCTYAAGEDATRAAANGGTTLEDVASTFASQIGDWTGFDTSANTRAYSDYSVGLLADSIDSYVQAFQDDGVSFRLADDKVSVLVPDTPIVLDIVTGDQTSGLMTPLYVSRSVANLTEVEEYYLKAFGVAGDKYVDGDATIIDYTLSSTATVIIRYSYRPGQTGNATTSWFQNLLLDTARQYQTSPSSCWPIWGDFHYAYDGHYDIKPIVDAAAALGYPYRSFVGESTGPSNVYVLEPSGMWIQLDGNPAGLPEVGGFDSGYCYTFCEDSSPFLSALDSSSI